MPHPDTATAYGHRPHASVGLSAKGGRENDSSELATGVRNKAISKLSDSQNALENARKQVTPGGPKLHTEDEIILAAFALEVTMVWHGKECPQGRENNSLKDHI